MLEKMKNSKVFSYPKTQVLKVLAIVGAVGAVGTALFLKRDKVKEAVTNLKDKFKKAS